MLIRALIYFAAVAALSLLAVWLVNHPGAVAIEWSGWRIDTSLAVLAVVVLIFAAVVAIVYRAWRVLRGSARAVGRTRRDRRRREGYLALTRGMVAVAAGDPDEARRQARQADAMLEEPPLTMLLTAQAAQLEGNEDAARQYFSAMLDRKETEFLALRGLLMQAERAGDRETALSLARRAHGLRPKTKWLLGALFDLEAGDGNWVPAQAALRNAVKHEAISAEDGRRKRAALLLQQAVEAHAAGDPAGALKNARRAHEADPGFQPAAVDLAGRLIEVGKTRQATKLVEEAWAREPHPGLAQVYAETLRDRDPVRRLQAMGQLEALRPDHPETHLAMARAALDAKLWGEARRHLRDAVQRTDAGVAQPSARHCKLLAEIEEAEHGNTAAARAWLARAAEAPPDPGWICDACGATAAAWSALCGHCGAFASIDWRLPPRVAPAIAVGSEVLPEPLIPAGEVTVLEAPEAAPPPSGEPEPAAENGEAVVIPAAARS